MGFITVLICVLEIILKKIHVRCNHSAACHVLCVQQNRDAPEREKAPLYPRQERQYE